MPKKTPRTRARSFDVDGQQLRLLRAARGWTQLQAAEQAGFSDRLIRKAESGGPLETQTLAVLAQLYSTPQRPLTPGDLLARNRR
jgi:transcriptional regulator with XRE-family HTH domain